MLEYLLQLICAWAAICFALYDWCGFRRLREFARDTDTLRDEHAQLQRDCEDLVDALERIGDHVERGETRLALAEIDREFESNPTVFEVLGGQRLRCPPPRRAA